MKYNATKKAYKEILSLLNQYKDVCNLDIGDIEHKSLSHLYKIELEEKYGIKVPAYEMCTPDFTRIDGEIYVAMCGETHGRTISWSDDGRQPNDELLYCFSFSTGAYIFGTEYLPELFKEFFNELKKYNPTYVDTVNHKLYFALDNAKDIHNAYPSILKKYQNMYATKSRETKVAKLQQELQSLTQ